LWEQIWSLNWDCVQERALENVGLVRGGKEAGLPWPTAFRTLITAADCDAIAADKTVKVIKPHGCVLALAEAEEAMRRGDVHTAKQLASRFLITAGELAGLAPKPGDPTQHFIFSLLSAKLSSHPLIIGGWSVSEEYFIRYIDEKVRPILQERQLAVDELCVIDVHFNDLGHTRLAASYGKARATAHVPVSDLTTDGLFLWIQTLYAFDCLREWAEGKDRISIEDLAATFDQPPDSPGYVSCWVDSFLPVWVRLCWRCGLVVCFNRGQPVAPHEIPLESRDEHVPWRIDNIQRLDLRSAAMLLAVLHDKGIGAGWDFEAFPGGLYRTGDNLLVIPLPAWDVQKMNNLRGLKPLTEAFKRNGAGNIARVAILPLTAQANAPVPQDTKIILKELLAREFSIPHLARSANIHDLDLANL
jgi:hypothetical protein